MSLLGKEFVDIYCTVKRFILTNRPDGNIPHGGAVCGDRAVRWLECTAPG